jgi:hypothetical protein
MQKLLGLTGLGLLVVTLATGQIKRQFSVDDSPQCEQIKLKLKANSGTCFIKPSHNPEILTVFSNLDVDSYAHQFKKEVVGSVCEVMLALEEMQSGTFSQTISSRVFSSENTGQEKFWKMYLNDTKPYVLEMNYGIGKANIDLSGLSVKNLKINTGSADVNVGYSTGLENKVDMDTFYVKVDLGSVHARNLGLAKTKVVIAEVGFGNVMLDLSSVPSVANAIKGNVGAGNLVIMLPSEETPVLVKIKDSWLCSVRIPAYLKKVGNNTFANAAYSKSTQNALTFDLDVSMGNIIFKEKQQ